MPARAGVRGSPPGGGRAPGGGAITADRGRGRTWWVRDCALPRASCSRTLELDGTGTPSPVNPSGVKGGGEAGAGAGTAAVANAVIDALGPLGIRHLDMPYTPQTVWRAIQGAKGGQA